MTTIREKKQLLLMDLMDLPCKNAITEWGSHPTSIQCFDWFDGSRMKIHQNDYRSLFVMRYLFGVVGVALNVLPIETTIIIELFNFKEFAFGND